jgi:rfaE bifunctional protein nucleotidyltransferase chain/domain
VFLENNKLCKFRSLFSEKTIVFANGAFDLIHVGHIRYLKEASKLGELLVVGINADSSVQKLKGEYRPIIPFDERCEIVLSLSMVNYITKISGLTAKDIIRKLKPNIHAKGTDYTKQTVPERDEVLLYGGRIEICGDSKDHSTTNILNILGEKV